VEEAFARLGLAPAAQAGKQEAEKAFRRSAIAEERRRLRRDSARARQRADALASELDAAERSVRELETLQCEPDVFTDPVRARDTADEAEAARRRANELIEAWGEAEDEAVALERRLAMLGSDQ
jgi:ATP-binding cassette subfamily F protein 3